MSVCLSLLTLRSLLYLSITEPEGSTGKKEVGVGRVGAYFPFFLFCYTHTRRPLHTTLICNPSLSRRA